jgi:hypothetical protein
MSPEELDPLKYSYDKLGQECLDRLDIISPPADTQLPRNRTRQTGKPDGEEEKPARDLYALLRDHAPKDEKLNELWTEVTQIPDWVDWEQIERGQDVFYRYGGPALTSVSLLTFGF